MTLLTETCAKCGIQPNRHPDEIHPFQEFHQEEAIEELGRGVLAVAHSQPGGRWKWSTRWPSAKEKDAMLAAGGVAVGTAESLKDALVAARRAKEAREG